MSEEKVDSDGVDEPDCARVPYHGDEERLPSSEDHTELLNLHHAPLACALFLSHAWCWLRHNNTSEGWRNFMKTVCDKMTTNMKKMYGDKPRSAWMRFIDQYLLCPPEYAKTNSKKLIQHPFTQAHRFHYLGRALFSVVAASITVAVATNVHQAMGMQMETDFLRLCHLFIMFACTSVQTWRFSSPVHVKHTEGPDSLMTRGKMTALYVQHSIQILCIMTGQVSLCHLYHQRQVITILWQILMGGAALIAVPTIAGPARWVRPKTDLSLAWKQRFNPRMIGIARHALTVYNSLNTNNILDEDDVNRVTAVNNTRSFSLAITATLIFSVLPLLLCWPARAHPAVALFGCASSFLGSSSLLRVFGEMQMSAKSCQERAMLCIHPTAVSLYLSYVVVGMAPFVGSSEGIEADQLAWTVAATVWTTLVFSLVNRGGSVMYYDEKHLIPEKDPAEALSQDPLSTTGQTLQQSLLGDSQASEYPSVETPEAKV